MQPHLTKPLHFGRQLASLRALLALALLGCGGVDDSGGVFYVNGATGKDSNTGRSPTSAFRTLTHALSFARGGAQIVVAEGLYGTSTGEVFPLTASDVSALQGAGPGKTVLVDERGDSAQVLSLFGAKEIRGFTIERRAATPCPQSCATLVLDDRPPGHVVVEDVALIPDQPNAWALTARGGQTSSAGVMTVTMRNVTVAGKGKGRGLAFHSVEEASVTSLTVNEAVTPALHVFGGTRLVASQLALGLTRLGAAAGFGGGDAPAIDLRQVMAATRPRVEIRETTLTFAYSQDDAMKVPVGIASDAELLLERVQIDLRATARGRGVSTTQPAQLLQTTIVGGELAGSLSGGAVVRSGSFRGQTLAGFVVSSRPGLTYDLGTTASPGHNQFLVLDPAVADVAVQTADDVTAPAPDVTAIGNVWTPNRGPCHAITDWYKAEPGSFQIVVEPKGPAVLRAEGERCQP